MSPTSYLTAPPRYMCHLEKDLKNVVSLPLYFAQNSTKVNSHAEASTHPRGAAAGSRTTTRAIEASKQTLLTAFLAAHEGNISETTLATAAPIGMVPEAGLEPARAHMSQWILSPLRLPIPPLRHDRSHKYTAIEVCIKYRKCCALMRRPQEDSLTGNTAACRVFIPAARAGQFGLSCRQLFRLSTDRYRAEYTLALRSI